MKSEKQIEQGLVKAVKNMGGIAPKFAFVEVKAPGKKPRPLQGSRHGLLQHLGFKVYLLNDMNQIGGILDDIRTA